MKEFIVFLAVLASASGSCPPGFELVRDGECRGLYKTITTAWNIASETAPTVCLEINGKPVIIHNEEQQSYWKMREKSFTTMALVCNTTSKHWEWADGTVLDYKPIKYDPELDQNCTPHCSWALHPDDLWHYSCGTQVYTDLDVYCSTQLPKVVPIEDDCERFENDSDYGVCYQIGETAENFKDAQKICGSFGATLASIHNAQENSFVRRLAVSKGKVQGIFLGATTSGKGNDYQWLDGSAWDYSNFYPEFPMNGLGDCLAMDTQVSSAQWVNTDCNSKLSVACERKPFDLDNYTSPVCKTGPWREGDIIFSPGFPFDASVPCDYMLMVDEGKEVEVEIIMLEANSCCDNLVLFDNFIAGNVVANLTGELYNKTYTTKSSNFMRVAWQPNGGVNVQGFMMTFRGVG